MLSQTIASVNSIRTGTRRHDKVIKVTKDVGEIFLLMIGCADRSKYSNIVSGRTYERE